MSLLSLVMVLVVIGVILYLVNQHLPMDPKIKSIMNVVVVVAVVLWLLGIFFPSLPDIRVGTVR